jgi:hypothetical protein
MFKNFLKIVALFYVIYLFFIILLEIIIIASDLLGNTSIANQSLAILKFVTFSYT